MRITAELRQWCPECQAATANVACPLCVMGVQACAVCGTHPGEHNDDEDEDE